ncbi:LysE family transporter [Demequina lutea]|uniref:Arginine exporter protein ArgO n=1 Tax=Demequina lutea TaxID=431489 RepID=A0A7Z0CKK6_9MICO|nr:LysE family transporter [Demequina lutea]NYI41927.1 arginine exporter protein ArgO [Demequina lutea]
METGLIAPALAGATAGLAIAMPLGAIGLLLLRLGMLHGFRSAAAAALAVGCVDLAYCAAAVTVGSKASPLIESWGAVPMVVSGAVVIGIGLRQLVTSLTAPDALAAPPKPGRPLAVFGRFVALTAMNPLTVLYFIALAGVLAGTSSGFEAKAAFVAGTGAASISWQLGLAAVGAVMHRTISARTGRVLGIVASAIVILLGAAVIVRALVWG